MPINPTPITSKEDKKDIVNKEPSFYITEPKYSFEDIILSDEVLKEIDNFIILNECHSLIFDTWGLGTVLKNRKNITANLYGESGTGKTMAAHAIADKLRKQLLIVNYSEIESKYVGETSKNLVNLFKTAKKQDAIILFDEADALLSKRVTAMQSATDVSVNQTRNVLLKLLDDYEGIILFTTNFISNFDVAFFRRIMTHIQFDLPNLIMRQKLWAHYIVDKLPIYCEKIELVKGLSEIENITGSDIANAVLRTTISSIQQKKESIDIEDFKIIIEKIKTTKRAVTSNNYEISTKQVSEEYVKEKLGKEIIKHEA